jgi:osmotically-inducible protein OsmY
MEAIDELRTGIHRRLQSDPHVGGQNIQFELVDRDVLLSGSVRSYFQKQMAQECVLRITGVRQVVNTLEVRGPKKTSQDFT